MEKQTIKYCRSCGHRLVQPETLALNDGAYWRFGYRCLKCRMKSLIDALLPSKERAC